MTAQHKLMFRLAILIFIIFGVNFLATKFFWYNIVWWFDMPMHALGGLWVALASLFVYLGRYKKHEQVVHPKEMIIIGLIGVLFIGGLWEVFEFVVQAITHVALANPIDSLSDICFDLVGGIGGSLYVANLHRNTS
jgi:hypothetical protein